LVSEALTVEGLPLFEAFAEAAVESLVSGLPFCDRSLSQAVSEAFRSENADAGDEAAARCSTLRAALAAAAYDALARRRAELPEAAWLLTSAAAFAGASPTGSGARVEVRGTAGRQVLAPAFALGCAAECDVQAVGDQTVPPVHCIAVALPGGVLVVDLCLRPSARCSDDAQGDESPVALLTAAPQRAVFAVAWGKRVVHRIGARTRVAFGPSAAQAERLARQRALTEALAKRSGADAAPHEAPAMKARKTEEGGLSTASTSFGSLFSVQSSEPSSRSQSPSC